jgi:tetratricopeptide (TPR) repeat protein
MPTNVSHPGSARDVAATGAREWRTVRVFVSSTFRDMQAERDELVRSVFPQLRRLCRARGIECVEVDLRWGVTEEQAERGEVLRICLSEIGRCRPYFIGVLGERYGSVPDAVAEDLVEEHPWLDAGNGRSITELEILHGALNDPEHAPHAFFYFRDPGYARRLPTEQQKDFEAEGPDARSRLDQLKQRIMASGLRVRAGYADARQLGQRVLEDLTASIDLEHPPGVEPDPLDREAAVHDAFAQSRAWVYIGREAYHERLDAHAAGDGGPLMVLGASGSGKSALLGNWVRRYRRAHPDVFVLDHYLASGHDSADHVRLVRRIVLEIKRRYRVVDDVPDDPAKLCEAFPDWLARAAARGRMVLVLDALDQLENRSHAHSLGWLPGYLPRNVRLVVSTLPGTTLTALERRGCESLVIEPLTRPERARLLVEYLAHHNKALGPDHVDTIVSAEQTGVPLFLRTLLNELRVVGKHERLSAMIEDYLGSETTVDLFARVLSRFEADLGAEPPDLVARGMSLLWAARRGLSEAELGELLGSREAPVARAVLSALLLAAEDHIVDRSGLLTFSHGFLREAVKRRYLPDDASVVATRMRIADHFAHESDERTADELPWQLREPGSWDRLEASLTRFDVLGALNTDRRRYELLDYWRTLEGRSDVVACYEQALASAADQPAALVAERTQSVAVFLEIAARYEGAERLCRRALEIREIGLGPDHIQTAESLYELAGLVSARGDHGSAEQLYRRSLRITQAILGEIHTQTGHVVHALAALCQKRGDLDEAEALFRQAIAIYEKAADTDTEPWHISTSRSDLGGLLLHRGDHAGAEPLLEAALAGYERDLGPEHPHSAAVRSQLASLLQAKGDYAGAERLHRRSHALLESTLGPQHPQTAKVTTGLARVLSWKGDLDGAEELFRRGLRASEAAFGEAHLDTVIAMQELGCVLLMKGRPADAERLLVVAQARLKAAQPEHPYHAQISHALGQALRAKGEYPAAERQLRSALAVTESAFGATHPDVPIVLCALGQTLQAMGDPVGAEQTLRRALAIEEAVLGAEHPNTAVVLNVLGRLLESRADHAGAEELFRRALAIEIRVVGRRSPRTADVLHALGRLQEVKGDVARAEELYREALDVLEHSLGPAHFQTRAVRARLAALASA